MRMKAVTSRTRIILAPQDDADWAERSAYWAAQIDGKPVSGHHSIRSRRPPLILSGHGVSVGVDHGALLVRNGFTLYPQQREEWRFYPGDWRIPSRIIVLDGKGALTFHALRWLAAQDIPLINIDWQGEVIHVVGASGRATERTLAEAQLAARANGRWLEISRQLISDKIANSIATLRKAFPKSPATELALSRIGQLAQSMKRTPPATVSDLLGVEGRVASAYFGAWQSYPLRWKGTERHPIPDDWKRVGPRGSMAGTKDHRNRHATHPVNAMLNYAYGILEHQVRMHVVGSGFDPTIGLFHGSYRGKTALVYDLMEPLRPVVDRSILDFVQAHTFSPADFMLTGTGVCRLNPQVARTVVKTIDVGSAVVKLITQFSSAFSFPAALRHRTLSGNPAA